MTKREKDAEVAEVSAPVAPADAGKAGEPTEEPAPSVDELRRRLEEAERYGQELFAKLQYAQADLENLRKRAEREVDEAIRFANERLLASLLPVIDEFDAALGHVDAESAKGIEMVCENLLKTLREAGLEEVPTAGKFDPYVHEAVGHVNDSSVEDGSIKEVVQKGYRFNFKLLRPAKVIVVRKGGET